MEEYGEKLKQFIPSSNVFKVGGYILIYFLAIVSTIILIKGITSHNIEIGKGFLLLIIFLIGIVMVITFVRILIYYFKMSFPKPYEKILIPENILTQKEKEIYEMVQDISQKVGLKKIPKIKIVNTDEVNAMALSLSKNKSIIFIYDGLIKQLDRDSLEAVIAHEIGHIYNGDSLTSTLLHHFIYAVWILVALVPYLFLLLGAYLSKDEKVKGLFIALITLLFTVVSKIIFFLGSMIVNFHSRLREFKADKFASIVTKPEFMIKALTKLKSYTHFPALDEYAILKIHRPVYLLDFFATHPHLDRRIKAVEEFIKNPVKKTVEEKREYLRGYLISGFIIILIISIVIFFSSDSSTYQKTLKNAPTSTQTQEPQISGYSILPDHCSTLKSNSLGYIEKFSPDLELIKKKIESLANVKITERKTFYECIPDPYFRDPILLKGEFIENDAEEEEILLRLFSSGCKRENEFETVYLILGKYGLKKTIIERGFYSVGFAGSINAIDKTKILLYETYIRMGAHEEILKICEVSSEVNNLICYDLLHIYYDNLDFLEPESYILKLENIDINSDGILDLAVFLKADVKKLEEDKGHKSDMNSENLYRVEFLFDGQNYKITEKGKITLSDWQKNLDENILKACEESKLEGYENLNCKQLNKK